LLHKHPHLSSGAGTIGQKRPQHKGLSPTPLAIKENTYLISWALRSRQFCSYSRASQHFM
jgi:hypothetical protein